MKRLLLLLVWMINGVVLNAQPDTLTFEQFMLAVKNYHPVAKQGALIPEFARQNLRMARGGFDPVLGATYDQKSFDSKNYWMILESKLQIPTWYGITFQGGYQYAAGTYLDPSRTYPDVGLPQAGVAVTLGKGLYMDERRAALKQAKIFNQASVYEQILFLNELYYEAVKAYMEWSVSYAQYKIFQNAVELAKIRYNGVKISFQQGDRPAVDTLEAYLLLQSREAGLLQAQIEYTNARYQISNFLWTEDEKPAELRDNVFPVNMIGLAAKRIWTQDSLTASLANLNDYHPEIRLIAMKGDMLEVERKLKISKLFPQLDVNYNFLYNPNQIVFFTDNYKFGVDFKIPIPFRESRGSLGMTRIKILENQYKLEAKSLQVANKIKAYYNEFVNYTEQVSLYQQMFANYRMLFLAELSKFELGESSVFLVNAREVKLIEAELKLYEIIGKYNKAYYGLMQSTGRLLF